MSITSRAHATSVWFQCLALAVMMAASSSGSCQAISPRLIPSNRSKPSLPAHLRFEPAWRESGDCGPMSLYVLMRLLDRKVSIAAVKNAVPIDSEIGCSLADVARGAEALGLETDIRFVKPDDVPRLDYPCILHTTGSLQKGTGHFFVVAGYDPQKREYSVVDIDVERALPTSEEALLNGFSGYVLMPKVNSMFSARVGGLALVSVGCVLGAITFFGGSKLRFALKAPKPT
jgi:hypothetical protein